MGKRKHHDEEEYLARKIKKMEKKISRLRRKQRSRHSPAASSNQFSDSSQEAPQYEGAPCEVNTSFDSTPHEKVIDVPLSTPIVASTSAPKPASVIVPMPTSTPTPPDATAQESAATENSQELEPDILCLLGEEPIREEQFGANVHKDIACRWSDILVNGLKEETRSDILKGCNVPENLKLVQAPTLNPEIRAAVNESALKRDNILANKQKLLSFVVTTIAKTLTSVLMMSSFDEEIKSRILKSLSDAGRLLCYIHYNETQTRRNFLLTCLNKEIKDNVKDLKRDHLLFGNDLQDNLKSMKAIIRTGAEMKPTSVKPKLPTKNLQPKESTSRALNWRGPPPPQSQPRRMPARQSSTAGGRKQQSTRRATDQRTPQQRSRTRTSRR